MDVAGEPALLRSLKNARDAIVVHLMKIIMDSSAYEKNDPDKFSSSI